MRVRPARIILVTLLLLLPTGGYAEEHVPGATWEHLAAGSGGWSAATLAKAEAWSNLIGSTAVMIVQHGLVVAAWGDAAIGGPLRVRLGGDGSVAVFKRESAVAFDTGTWNITDNRYCRDWQEISPHHACFAVIRDGADVQLFDRNGLMVVDGRLTE